MKVKDLSKGLGSNIGDEKWQAALEKKRKQEDFDKKLRNMNKKYGVVVTENSLIDQTAKFAGSVDTDSRQNRQILNK